MNASSFERPIKYWLSDNGGEVFGKGRGRTHQDSRWSRCLFSY